MSLATDHLHNPHSQVDRSYSRHPCLSRRRRRGLAVIGLVDALVWRSVLATPDGHLYLEMLDVARPGLAGDAIFIQTSTGRHVLVDGVASTHALSDALGRLLLLDQRRLDWLVVVGTYAEQIASLPDILPRFTPNQVL